MTDEERQKVNDTVHSDMLKRIGIIEDRLKKIEDRSARRDVEYAVINTKLSAILWGIGVAGTAIIGVLIKLIFGM